MLVVVLVVKKKVLDSAEKISSRKLYLEISPVREQADTAPNGKRKYTHMQHSKRAPSTVTLYLTLWIQQFLVRFASNNPCSILQECEK